MKLGADLLNPPPDLSDLKKQSEDLKRSINSVRDSVGILLQKELEKVTI